MGVQAQGVARAKGGISLGGNLDLGQLGAGSPAMWSGILFLVLLAVLVLIVMSLRG